MDKSWVAACLAPANVLMVCYNFFGCTIGLRLDVARLDRIREGLFKTLLGWRRITSSCWRSATATRCRVRLILRLIEDDDFPAFNAVFLCYCDEFLPVKNLENLRSVLLVIQVA